MPAENTKDKYDEKAHKRSRECFYLRGYDGHECGASACKELAAFGRACAAEAFEEAAQEAECLFNGEVTRCNKTGICAGCLSAARLRGRAAALRQEGR